MTSPTASPHESRGIADLEVRSRMAGRWTMATIQFVFTVTPALIYWFAGQKFVGTSINVGTVVAFTTLQARLLFPIQSLLGAGADIEASLALFDRIFEYIDLPVDIVEAEHPVELDPSRVVGEVRFEGVSFRYDTRPSLNRRSRARRPAPMVGRSVTSTCGPGGDADGDRGGDRRRQDDARLSRGAALRAAERADHDRRRRHSRRVARRRWRRRSASSPRRRTCSTPRCARTSVRAARRDRRGDRGRRANGASPRPDRVAAGRLRHGRGRAGLPLQRGREAAHGDRAHGPAQPAGADLR